MYENQTYRPGDIVNGYVLTDFGWIPLGTGAHVVHVSTSAHRPTYPGRGMAIAGMVLGIVAWGIAILTFGLGSGVSFVLSVIGLPLSVVGFRESNRVGGPTGVSIAGIALNAVGLALAVLLFLVILIGAASSGSAA